MIKKYLEKLANIQEKFPLIVILLVLTLCTFLGYYALRIETDSSFDVMFREDSETITLQNLIDNEFGGTDTLFVLAKIAQSTNDKEMVQDIRHPDVVKAMDDLKNSLQKETFVASAFCISDLFYQVYGTLPSTLEESKQMIENMPEEVKVAYLGTFLSDDYQFQNMMISVSVESTPGYLQKIEANVREKIEQMPFPMGVTAELTGMPILINRIMNYLINDNIRTIFLALAGVFIILWFYFRSWKIALLSIIPTSLTLLCLAGIMYLLDIRITLMTASVGAMIIGMSVDYSIHLTHRFHLNVKEGKKKAAKDTVVGVGSALFASVLTTVAGFLAMLLGVSPNSQVQGTVLSIGVSVAFILTILILPPLMILQRKIIYSRLDETLFKVIGRRESTNKSIIDRFLIFIARFQVKKPLYVLITAGIITFLLVPGFGLVYLDTDGENWIPEGDDVLEGLINVGNNFGGTESMNLIFTLNKDDSEEYDPDGVVDLRDPRVMQPMSQLDVLVEDLRWVNSVDSPTNSIKQLNNGRIPSDYEETKRLLEENPGSASQFNQDYTIALFTPRADVIDRGEYYELLNELDGVSFPQEVEIIPQGSVPEDIELEQTLGADTMKTALIGFLFVIIIASLFYRSFIAGLLAFFPIIFAIIWTIGIMGYINLPFTVLTTGMLAILMGMGIDFSIHLIHSIEESMKDYNNKLEEAIPYALMSTGQAISTTTITTVLGFMALSFATLVNTMRLGWTLAIGIAATFFACTIIVPSVMALKYKRKLKKKA